MHQLEKNIKGITLLEILVVIAIIGVISGFSYPSISDWRSSRLVKDEVQQAASLFQQINAQVQRGQYSYVQVEVDVVAESITLTSKGMQTSNFSSLINSDWWGQNRENRCQTTNDHPTTLGRIADHTPIDNWCQRPKLGTGKKLLVTCMDYKKRTWTNPVVYY